MNKELSQFLTSLKHEKNASPHTIASYKRDLLQLANYLEEKKVKLGEIDNVVLRGFLAKLQEKKTQLADTFINSNTPFKTLSSNDIEQLFE